ncbi:MAG: NADH-quinone oxidoreductase subunit J [Pirellulaceae bacterium]|nr:NADH-quinone oxidoreductase subunit J [Pirellulaceae bacterium]
MNAALLGQTDWMTGHSVALLPPLLGFLAIWWLMPRAKAWPRAVGVLLGLAALVSGGLTLFQAGDAIVSDALFGFFALAAIVSAALMITNRNPLYSALWFAVVTLCVCGLFLLRSAPYLAAATVIVYAGAIIVTFLFLIMLAQQAVGVAVYDQRARQPLAATLLGFLVLGALICALRPWTPVAVAGDVAIGAAEAAPASQALLRVPPALAADPLSQRGDRPVGEVRGLGRVLFSKYLYAIELAGTLLLAASVGAIAIALSSRRGAT